MYKKTVLANGLTVVTESISYYSTVSLGMWWKTGGRFEKEESNGISHFIEHMLFKGTRRRSAYDIAREIDAVGGAMNAFTGKEYTCLYARVLRKDTDLALDILSDMYKNSLFQDDDLEREKYVIAQEIKMVEDNPEEYIYEMFNASYFKGHALGLPILGKQENIEKFTREELVGYFEEHYAPRNIIITATGRIDHDTFVRKVMDCVDGFGPCGAKNEVMEMPSANTGIHVYEKDLEHVYLCIGTHGVSQIDRKRYCLYLLNAIMGGSMSSHLFQEIREKRGLVYNIYSYVNCYYDAGTFGISTSTSVEFVDEVLGLIKQEISRIRDEGITDAELAFSKEHLKGNLFISLEGSETRMGRLAKNEIYFGDYIPLKDTLREIDRIAKPGVDEIGKEIFSSPEGISLTILGGVDKDRIEELWKG
ncbi:M16 family metallopeptidase [Syntrophorhabdus aromaticivorans]|uniref:M16 family metallopeptidase n=1 Tax=Syntrophorhabdus aromaticivorans TaxID=328301 RepID=UPI00041A8350|nr:pitrilysin family protein [Syntrophorhabdus aromaticivorans]